MSSEEAGDQPPADGHHPAFFPASNPDFNGQPPQVEDPSSGNGDGSNESAAPPEIVGQTKYDPMDLDISETHASSLDAGPSHSSDSISQLAGKADDRPQDEEQSHTDDFAALDLDSMSSEERAAYLAMITEAATSVVPSAVGSPQQTEMPGIDMDQIQQAVSDAVATAGLELQAQPQPPESDGHPPPEQDDNQVQEGHAQAEQDTSMEQDVQQDPPSSPPAFDMSHFGESSLQAIAAAQIAAGLGDFDFSGDDQAEAAQAPSGDATAEQGDAPGGTDTSLATTDQGDQASAVSNAATVSGENTVEGPRGTKRGREDEETEPQSASDLLDQFTTTSAVEGDEDSGDYEPITQSSIDAMTAAATAAVAGEQAKSPPAPTQTFQKAFSQFTFKPTTTEDAFQRYAPARTEQAASTTGARPPRPLPTPRPPIGPSSVRPTPPPRPAPGPQGKPPGGTTGTMPRPPSSFPRPPPPPALATDGTTHRAMPRPMPRLGARPAPPRPESRPPGGPARPAAPALPASALFSGGAASGAPSFAALLSTLGPKDLAMVAHAAMGLDAEGNPLPGNEESHRALADAMKRLRESTMQPPPPPPPAGNAGSAAQSTQQKATPSAQPKAKAAKKEGDKAGEDGKSSTAKKAQNSTPGSASSPNRSLPPDTVQRVLDALPRNTGDPLQDKQPLIAGPKPDRAPPKPGPPPEKRFQCPKCDRAFARAYNLNTHLSTHDPDPHRSKPFPCPYPSCRTEKRSFSRKHDLQRHIASTHESEPEPEVEVGGEDGEGEPATATLAQLGLGAPGRKFRCECGRAFVRRDALRRHNCEAMKAKWPEYANQDNSASARRGAKGEQLSVLEQASDADFDAIAASFAAAAEEEMRAAQEHAARAAANRDSAEGSEDEPNANAAAPSATVDQSQQDKAAAESKTKNADEAQDDGGEGSPETHTDDALAKLASQLTADAAFGMGLDMSTGGADQEQGKEPSQAQQAQEQARQPEHEQHVQQHPPEPERQNEAKGSPADVAAAQQGDKQQLPADAEKGQAGPEAGTENDVEGAPAGETASTALQETTDARRRADGGSAGKESKQPEVAETSDAVPAVQEPPDAPPAAQESSDAPQAVRERPAAPPSAAEPAGPGGEEEHGPPADDGGANNDDDDEDFSEQQVNDAASQFMAQLQGQLGHSGDDDESGGGSSNLMGDLLASMTTGGEGERQDVEMTEMGGDGKAESKAPERLHSPTDQHSDDDAQQSKQPPSSPKLIPKREEEEDEDDTANDGALQHLTPDTSITA